MNWNLDFLYVGVVIELLLLYFLQYRNMLKLRKNYLFKRSMQLTLLLAVFNLLSTVIDEYFAIDFASLNYIANTGYFLTYGFIYYYIFLYCVEYLAKGMHVQEKKQLYRIPIYFHIALILTNIFTGWVYTFNAIGNFERGPFYVLLNVEPFCYAISLFKLRNRINESNKRDDMVIGLSVVLLLIGTHINMRLENVLFLECMLALTHSILFVTMENPEYYIHPITKTYNIKAFRRLINEYISKKVPFYVMGAKITNYESLANYYGLLNLNQGLFALSKWIKQQFNDAQVFYLNNHTYVIVSKEPFDAKEMNERIQTRMLEPFIEDKVEIYFRLRVFSMEDTTMYSSMDLLLYAINYSCKLKETEFITIDTSIYDEIKQRQAIKELMNRRLKDRDVEIYIQPLYGTKEKSIVGGEVLARLKDDDGNIIPPGAFIDLAEESGSIIELGMIVFEKTCAFLEQNDIQKEGIQYLSVNISPVQFGDPRLVDQLEQVAMQYHQSFSFFDFEITESSLVSNERIVYHVNRLKEKGAYISLDDFGKGESNIERLTNIPVTVAKLDMSLVWNYFDGKNKIMENMIRVFQGENLEIVAEGVETKEMVDGLCELGCDYLQGYYFSKPLCTDAFVKFIKEFNTTK